MLLPEPARSPARPMSDIDRWCRHESKSDEMCADLQYQVRQSSRQTRLRPRRVTALLALFLKVWIAWTDS